MGLLLTFPLSPWERDHIEGLILGIRHEAATGELPQGPMWSMLERRYDLNPERFTSYHPNIARMIDRSRDREANPRPDVWPIDRPNIFVPVDRCETPIPPPDPCLNPQVVPEPSSLFGMGAAIGIWFLVYLWQRKVVRRSVGGA